METAVIYARVSTNEQKVHGISLDAQVAKCEQYAKGLNLKVVYVGVEGLSGKDADNRPELQTILAMVNKKAINHVLTVKLDRLSRDTEDSLRIGKMVTKKRVSLHLVTEGGYQDLSDPAVEAMFTMRAMMGRFERRRISLNTKFALARKRDLGERISRRAPYGYTFVNGKVVWAQDEQDVIVKIKGLHARGYSERRIIAQLTEDGVFNREGHQFNRSTIRTVLAMAA
jgi:DNA invertase Pin-like site-specific DNA recombinase